MFSEEIKLLSHNPCFSGNSFAIEMEIKSTSEFAKVTILVLVETPLQSQRIITLYDLGNNSHNPCFSGNPLQ